MPSALTRYFQRIYPPLPGLDNRRKFLLLHADDLAMHMRWHLQGLAWALACHKCRRTAACMPNLTTFCSEHLCSGLIRHGQHECAEQTGQQVGHARCKALHNGPGYTCSARKFGWLDVPVMNADRTRRAAQRCNSLTWELLLQTSLWPICSSLTPCLRGRPGAQTAGASQPALWPWVSMCSLHGVECSVHISPKLRSAMLAMCEAACLPMSCTDH